MARGSGGTRIGGIVVDVLGNSASIEQTLKDVDRFANTAARNFQRSWQSADKALVGVGRTATNVRALVLSAVAGASLGQLTRNAIARADAIADEADALGITTRAYQSYAFAASQADIDRERFSAGFSKFVQFAQSAASGDKGPLALFKRLGIDARESADDIEGLFERTADQLAKLPEDERLKTIGEIFGKKVALQWDTTLRGGKSGLDEMASQAEALGLIIKDQDIRALGGLGDQLDAIRGKMEVAFAQGLVEGLTDKTGDFTELVKDPAVIAALNDWATLFREIGSIVGTTAAKASELAGVIREIRRHPASVAGGIGGAALGGFPGLVVGTAGGFILDETVFADDRPESILFPSNAPKEGETGPPLPPGFIEHNPRTPPPGSGSPLGKPTATSEEEQAAKERERHAEQIRDFVAALRAEALGLQLEATSLGKSAAAQQEAAVQKELAIALTDKAVAAGSREAKQIEEAIRLRQQAANLKAGTELVSELEAEVAALEGEATAQGQATRARVTANTVRRVEAELLRQGITLTDEQAKRVQKLAERMGALAEQQEQTEKLRAGFEDVGQTAASAFERAIFGGEKLSDVLVDLGKQLAQLAFRRLLAEPFVDALGDAAVAIGKSFGDETPTSTSGPEGEKLVFRLPEDVGSQAALDTEAQNTALLQDNTLAAALRDVGKRGRPQFHFHNEPGTRTDVKEEGFDPETGEGIYRAWSRRVREDLVEDARTGGPIHELFRDYGGRRSQMHG